jgi:hypothetical protein
VARALYSTPLTLDPARGTPRPGLCSGWDASPDFRTWTFTCRAAPSIAGALRRVRSLPDAPLHWVFDDAEIRSPDAAHLVIKLPFSWRRFPYVLTAVGGAPRSVPGPFALVSGGRSRVVVRRDDLTVEFLRLGAREAIREFRAGRLDEAPVPLGDTKALASVLGNVVHTRRLLGLDLVTLSDIGVGLRRAYWQTANRGDYEQLVSEQDGSAAYALVGLGEKDPAAFRRAVDSIPALPRVPVRIAVDPDPTMRYAARLLYAQWRDIGLGPRLVTGTAPSVFRRMLAAYPQEEAIPAELALRDGIGPRGQLVRALGATQQHGRLLGLDKALESSAEVVPVAWVVDARLVSPRLRGWEEDVLGNVDYSVVRSQASSRRP